MFQHAKRSSPKTTLNGLLKFRKNHHKSYLKFRNNIGRPKNENDAVCNGRPQRQARNALTEKVSPKRAKTPTQHKNTITKQTSSTENQNEGKININRVYLVIQKTRILHSPLLRKMSSRHFSTSQSSNRNGYCCLISVSFSQVASLSEPCLHRTLTIGICLLRSCRTSRSKILTGSILSKDK